MRDKETKLFSYFLYYQQRYRTNTRKHIGNCRQILSALVMARSTSHATYYVSSIEYNWKYMYYCLRYQVFLNKFSYALSCSSIIYLINFQINLSMCVYKSVSLFHLLFYMHFIQG